MDSILDSSLTEAVYEVRNHIPTDIHTTATQIVLVGIQTGLHGV